MNGAPPAIEPIPVPPGAGVMPHVPGQTIKDLLLVRPDVHMDPKVSALMPDMLTPTSNIRHTLAVVDPNFIRGFRVGDPVFQVYLMPDNPYAGLSQAF